MYTPSHHREQRPEALAEAIRDIRLAALVTRSPDGLKATHLPMILKDRDNGWVLEGHVARANDHWAILDAPVESLAIFQGPQAYVSPGWYASKRQHGKVVPTWNYVAVHAHGPLERIEDDAWLRAHLEDLTTVNEAAQEHPWAVADAPAEFTDNLRRAIVGLRLTVDRLEGSWKMTQHRSAGDREGTAAGLARSPRAGDRDVAELMRKLEGERAG